ncbi:MAG: lysophospholipid acyltransferase family protein [bacterium]
MKLSIKYGIALNLLKIISKTWRFQITGTNPGSPGILAFWHGDMLAVWKYFSDVNPVAVISQSRDGEILSGLLSKWNYSLIRGSSSKGSKEALTEIVEKASNNLVLITPDGPRGPYHEFKPGAVVAAQRSGTKLYLCNVKMSSKFRFKKSWDKFSLPLPFSKISLNITEISSISQNAGRDKIDEIIRQCSNILNS